MTRIYLRSRRSIDVNENYIAVWTQFLNPSRDHAMWLTQTNGRLIILNPLAIEYLEDR